MREILLGQSFQFQPRVKISSHYYLMKKFELFAAFRLNKYRIEIIRIAWQYLQENMGFDI